MRLYIKRKYNILYTIYYILYISFTRGRYDPSGDIIVIIEYIIVLKIRPRPQSLKGKCQGKRQDWIFYILDIIIIIIINIIIIIIIIIIIVIVIIIIVIVIVIIVIVIVIIIIIIFF